MSDLPKTFRLAFQLIYLGICVLFVGTVAVAATWGAFAGGGIEHDVTDSPAPIETSSSTPAQTSCPEGLKTLHSEMSERAFSGFHAADAKNALSDWRTWSVAWRARLKALRSRCIRPNETGRMSKSTFRDVERLQRAYDTALTGFIELGRNPLGRLRPTLLSPPK